MKILRTIAIFLLFCIPLSSCYRNPTNNDIVEPDIKESLSADTATDDDKTISDQRTTLNYNNMKAMWLSQFDLQAVYTANGKQRSKDDFTQKINTVLSNVAHNGFNTVILQIRPYADSFYPSEVYPPSRYVTGSYEKDFEYDPLDIVITEAHALGLSIHGWINPMRCMTPDEIQSVDNRYKIKEWYLDKSKYGTYLVNFNSRLYFNPAYSDVRDLIISGVKEIISIYNFDGIHMDDYFYPTADDSFDKAAYTDYVQNNGNIPRRQFRYNNLNLLVSGIYSAIKEENKDIIFGISPEGNMSNVTDKAFADVKLWCSQDGYIDYICPQIYFGLKHGSHPFDKVANDWSNIVTNKNVKLKIGMTFGKALSKTDKWAGSGSNEWAESNDILKRCLEYTKSIDKCSGVFVFCYQYFYDPSTNAEVNGTAEERNNFIPLLKEIEWQTNY